MVKPRWTKKQKEVAALVARGKTFSEIVKAGFTENLTHRVMTYLKQGEEPPAPKTASAPASRTSSSASTPASYRQPETRVRDRVVDAVELGTILAMPEDWRLNQHDIYLLLDTYYLTKEEIGYEGSMGEFIGLVCRVYRHAMQYAELPKVGPVLASDNGEEGINDNGREEGGEGGRRGEEGVSGYLTEGDRSGQAAQREG